MDLNVCKYCLSGWEQINLYLGVLDSLTFLVITLYIRKIANKKLD